MPPNEAAIRLSQEGKAFKTRFEWSEHENAAWVMVQGLHGWVDRDSPIYMGSFRCSVKYGPGHLWTWRVEITTHECRYRARGYIPGTLTFGRNEIEKGKNSCFTAFRRLLVGLQSVP